MEYESVSFMAAPKSTLDQLQKAQNEALRTCLNLPRYIRTDLLHEYAGIDRISDRMKTLNKRLVQHMTRFNFHIKQLTESRLLSENMSPKSPLDVLFS